ncbi:hypothetical protein BOTNAR_0256g00060 [Botryotinia narcissicola]|uniref:Uncharacterized protein n=1 Tax=Botryotinia narcissicola TaxID=278944 RepID=A0A4Z1I0G6_9HELO|nr:hypothetical protein BOTNAR_0256g00060 [Botryotinia narcissicola]
MDGAGWIRTTDLIAVIISDRPLGARPGEQASLYPVGIVAILDPVVMFPQLQATIRTTRFIILDSMYCQEESKLCEVISRNAREVLNRIGIEFIFRAHGQAQVLADV